MATVRLPRFDGRIEGYTVRNAPLPIAAAGGARPAFNRVAYAAAHVVVDPLAESDPFLDTTVDWDKTLQFRHYLWDLGFGVAEAMDTAQRGMGLDWPGRSSSSGARWRRRNPAPAPSSAAVPAPINLGQGRRARSTT